LDAQTSVDALPLAVLQLGIIPGFGGTQRLPRLVGLQKAAEMMLTSKPISEKAAKAAGLVDEVVSKDRRARIGSATDCHPCSGQDGRFRGAAFAFDCFCTRVAILCALSPPCDLHLDWQSCD
jgi:enoyl-CoA hydratase/carnithine racemase